MSFEDYEVLFAQTLDVGAPKPPCPPYEGLQKKSLSRHATMLQITAFYKHFGLEMDRQEGKSELPDHITAELEFLHFLTFKESQARESDDRELLTGYLLAQNDFLQRHPLRWIPAFAEELQAIRPGTALAMFAEITAGILQEEADLVRGYLKVLEVDAKPLEPEDKKPLASIPVEISDTELAHLKAGLILPGVSTPVSGWTCGRRYPKSRPRRGCARDGGSLVCPMPRAASTCGYSPVGASYPPTVRRFVRRDGTQFSAEVTAVPHAYEGQSGGIAVVRDISDRLRAEEEIRSLNTELEARVRRRTAQLERLNDELESFSYSVSHDLRAPLRAIHGFSGLLAQQAGAALDAQGRHYLERVQDAAARMGQLIDDLLELSRVTRAPVLPEPVDLSRLATQVVDELRAGEPQRAVEVVIAPGLAARGDPALLRAVLQNLLENAWKFTRGREGARIELSAAAADGRGRFFCVRDNGAGFDMRYAEKLFGAFQRLHTEEEFAGTGIGLATVQRIIARHGGRVWAEGEPGRGATFCFTLPDG